MKKILVSVAILCTLGVWGQKKEVTIETHKVTDKVYMLTGQGGNIGLHIGDEGVFMVDDQFAPLTPKILAAIKGITKKPVKYLVNTHWHGDHTGGNENMRKEGAVIVSHKNVRRRMSVKQFVRGKEKEAASKEALPVITFTEDMMIHLNGEDMLISHVHNAHTDGDAIVFFMKSNVIHMGDTYFQGKYPFIDLESGGSIQGYINAIDKVLLLANKETKIIPGHRKVSNKKELSSYKEMLVVLRDRIKEEIFQGKTLEEVEAAVRITQEYDKKYGGWFISGEGIRKTIYQSLINSMEK
ncbi:MBL fold metallo-hydrolase [Tenacibaculum maritimum]|uniref:MBL fold metallo-hydrolase n=1 Tax=Tenacibaculum maritimum TaxID=107401 RepID=UPI0012E4EFD0|nr:MBL fold metallo-hydrolase [Tenacibaculum maritimum]MCD9581705.1 MBL fold metallo-hydrolase [Tenacibaculum maritimum]MCD9636160.1 MBL fold metallo-hydrolase [Tenacibaculum maritimum]CAA0186028.1 Beta-lactamase-like protein [Tenacibaculum maritimum]CAA0191448.1 Beta-lactamase-like protein [Tenacibaculum maritimum]CAA0203006.1 Beta-lactamase-like protein [Tenacibaculum maritimum]